MQTTESQRNVTTPLRRENTPSLDALPSFPTTAEHPQWYLMTAPSAERRTVCDKVAAYAKNSDTDIEAFAPTFVALEGTDSRPFRIPRPLLGRYFFLRCTPSQLPPFMTANTTLSPLLASDTAKGRYQTVSDTAMIQFKRVAAVLGRGVPCFSLSEVDLEGNDLVRVIGGDFNGVEGRLLCRRGAEGGRVAISLGCGLAAATLHIEPRYIKVLEFAPGGGHIYDAMDSFLPRLRSAFKEKEEKGTLSLSTTASLGYFVTRYGGARAATARMRSRLSALVMASLHLLGDTDGCRTARLGCSERPDDTVVSSLITLCEEHP